MAVQFHELPVSVFPKECRPYIARLNRELRDLFGLEGSLSSERTTTRSDATVARQNIATVDISRITPSITNVVSGASTVVGVPSFTLGTVNATGSTTTAIATDSSVALFDTVAPTLVGTSAVGVAAYSARRDHSHAFSSSFHTGGYGTSATIGTSTSLLRADAILAFPEAIATAADRTKTLTLTDDATFGALVTASSAFGVTQISLLAPNATNQLNIGKWGNIALAGNLPDDTRLLSFQKTNFAVSGAIAAINGFVANTDAAGTARTLNLTSQITIAAGVTNSTGQIHNNLIGNISSASATSHATGLNTVLRLQPQATRGLNQTVGDVISLDISPLTHLRGTFTNITGVKVAPITVSVSGSLLNQYGVLVDSQVFGTTRIGVEVTGTATGTPTLAYGFHSSLHGVGTTRRAFIGDNSFECVQNHMIVGTSGFGFVVKDTVDGNYYMISTAGGVVGCSSLGATTPAV